MAGMEVWIDKLPGYRMERFYDIRHIFAYDKNRLQVRRIAEILLRGYPPV
jgi:hypothetical protein